MGYVTYEYNKERIKKWRADNKEAFKELNRKHARAFLFRKKQVVLWKKTFTNVLEELKTKFD